MIVADTSGLLAALDPDEVHHDVCRRVVESQSEPLLLSPFVLNELDYLVGRKLGVDAAQMLLEDVALGAYQLVPFEAGDVAACRNLVVRYPNAMLGIADASVMLLADRHRTTSILTLDERHFRAVRTDRSQPYRLLPADA